MQTVMRFIVMYQMMNFVTKSFGGGGKTGMSGNGTLTGGGDDAAGANGARVWRPAFSKSDLVDMYVYIDTHAEGPRFEDESSLVWFEESLPLSGVDGELSRSIDIDLASDAFAAVKRDNATVFVHCHFARTGEASPNPKAEDFSKFSAFGVTSPLIEYRPAKKKKSTKNLLAGAADDETSPDNAADTENGSAAEADDHTAAAAAAAGAAKKKDEENEEEDEEDGADKPWRAHLKPNVTIHIVDDFTRYEAYKAPPTVSPHLDVDLETGLYPPIVFMNDFWLLKDKYDEVNATSADTTTLHLRFGRISTMYWQILMQMEQSFKLQESFGAMNDGESDEIKRIFIEGNPYLLALTMVVSMLHTIFDIMAFRSDIGFWNKNKSMEGLSARMVVLNSFMQLVIFLYLLENDTSMVVLFSSGVGCAIEFWKITKCMTVEVNWSGRIPSISFKDKVGYQETNTKRYDREASVYLSYVLFPLVIGYSIYTLVYDSHKSWYSWILNSLVGAVYTFGFILMCPQLYINYKLKSVAHLPWRQMTFKFLNTIIDDLFAFVIKMPTLHRLSVFRDDAIFLIYLYQRWIYPVDKKRANEYGFAEEKPEIDADGNAVIEEEKKKDEDEDEEKEEDVRDEAEEETETKKDK